MAVVVEVAVVVGVLFVLLVCGYVRVCVCMCVCVCVWGGGLVARCAVVSLFHIRCRGRVVTEGVSPKRS